MTEQVNSPQHYNQRTVECVEFSRHLPHALATAFEYVWREDDKHDDSAVDRGKANWWIRDALVFRPVSLDEKSGLVLARRLMGMVDEFPPESFDLLICMIGAGHGDYEGLCSYAKDPRSGVYEGTAAELMAAL